ncbi:MFS transporter [Natranaerobius thermophilus]|uniref:MFS transporter n=1 Tax=Natranaerobius thermophilus TaxID=375929 RepID=UPI0002E4D03D|nr:MFS transporter [Natranaerobius thermophilus]
MLALAYLLGFFHRYSLGVVADTLREELALSGTALSNLASIYFYSYALMQIPSGILADTVGPRKVATIGFLLASSGSVLMGISQEIALLYLGRFLVGIGVAGLLICIFKIQSVWYRPEEFATMTGWSALMGNSGALFATTPFAVMVLNLGWQNSFILIGLFSFIILGLIWTFVRDDPQDLDYPPINRHHSTQSFKTINLSKGFKSVLSNSNTWFCFVILMGLHGAMMSFSGVWGVTYLQSSYEIAKDQAASLIFVFTLGVIVGSPVMGKLSDRLGNRKLLIQISAAVFLIFWLYKLVLWQGTPPTIHLPFLYFMGGFFAIFAMLCQAVGKESNDPSYTGIAVSVINTAPFIGTTVMNFFIGIVLDITGHTGVYGYRLGFLIYAVFSLIALICAYFLKEKSVHSS